MNIEENITDSGFAKSVRRLSLAKKKSFLSKMIDMKRLKICRFYRTTEQLDHIKLQVFQIIDALDKVYGSSWDMLFTENYHPGDDVMYYTITPIIRFKSFTIVNSLGHSRKINDLFVTVPISYQRNSNELLDCFLYFESPRGVRTTYDRVDFNAGYVHSHLRRMDPDIQSKGYLMARDFCLGSGEINTIIKKGFRQFEYSNLINYLLLIKTLVYWESVEGSPFYRIKNIPNTQTTVEDTDVFSFSSFMFNNFINNYEFKYVFNKDRYSINLDQQFHDDLKAFFIRHENYQFLCKRDDRTSTYVRYTDSTINVPVKAVEKSSMHFYFNGEKITLKVNMNKQQTSNIEETIIYPKFLEHVKQKLEQSLYKKLIRDNVTSRYAQGQNT